MESLKRLCILILFILAAQSVEAQETPVIMPIVANALATGNYKDAFTSFYQLAANDIIGPQKSLAIATNPYALMAKSDPQLLVDTNYLKYRHLRNLNFNAALVFDSAFRLNGFSIGGKYAIINARDNTISRYFLTKAIEEQGDFEKLHDALVIELSDVKYSHDFRIKANRQIRTWQNDSTFSYSKMDADVMDLVQKVIVDNNLSHFQQAIDGDPNYNFWVESHKTYEDLKQEWQTRPLWTVAGSSVFASNNTSGGNLVINNAWLASEFLMGINNAKSPVNMEMDILAIDSMSNSGLGKSIDRNVFALEPGINFVIKSGRNAARSVFEFKLSGTYYHTFSTPYKYEEQNRSSVNATLRLRIIDDTWIPVTFKLDDKGHVYGFIDFKFNFTTLANVATQYAQRYTH